MLPRVQLIPTIPSFPVMYRHELDSMLQWSQWPEAAYERDKLSPALFRRVHSGILAAAQKLLHNEGHMLYTIAFSQVP